MLGDWLMHPPPKEGPGSASKGWGWEMQGWSKGGGPIEYWGPFQWPLHHARAPPHRPQPLCTAQRECPIPTNATVLHRLPLGLSAPS